MTRVIMIPDDSSIIYTNSSLTAETLVEALNSASPESNLEVLESLTLTLDPARMRASRAGDLVVIFSRERESSTAQARNLSHALGLTLGQQRVLADLCEGYSQKEIALRLGISLRTVGVDVAELKQIIPSLSTLCRGIRPPPPSGKS